MGEDTINHAAKIAGLAAAPSRTVGLKLHGWTDPDALLTVGESERVYGSDLNQIVALGEADPSLNELLHPQLPYRKREVAWAIQQEQAGLSKMCWRAGCVRFF